MSHRATGVVICSLSFFDVVFCDTLTVYLTHVLLGLGSDSQGLIYVELHNSAGICGIAVLCHEYFCPALHVQGLLPALADHYTRAQWWCYDDHLQPP